MAIRNCRSGPVRGRQDRSYLGEYLAYGIGKWRESRTGSDGYEACHEGVLDEVLTALIPTDPQPPKDMFHWVSWLLA